MVFSNVPVQNFLPQIIARILKLLKGYWEQETFRPGVIVTHVLVAWVWSCKQIVEVKENISFQIVYYILKNINLQRSVNQVCKIDISESSFNSYSDSTDELFEGARVQILHDGRKIYLLKLLV